MQILAIETSCDETAVSIVKNGRETIANVIDSQIEKHKIFGGVVPEIASRMHIEKINACVQEALNHASLETIDAIAVTYGPGLVGALLVGVAFAKGLAFATQKPLVGVHHIEGHIAANYLEHHDLKPPFLCLVVSGGHTHLINVKTYTTFEIVGKTKDDAVGEAYDKVARTLGLQYPGGPKIDRLAATGDADSIKFPKAMLNDGYDFSFSGIKSAVLNYVNGEKMKEHEINAANVAASFQKSVVDILTHKTIKYAIANNIKTIVLAGGVAANSSLRSNMRSQATANNINLYYPSLSLCTDNAAMVGSAAYYSYIAGVRSNMSLNATPNLVVGAKPATGFSALHNNI
ncbi:tRNA (adenosine(37)-N6)-threonylcarbamoyltransferase complex transferase subunit TsaD [Candidatus Epulonipiscium viviparus]|uniref:tRNA (adenosine(37)-N6)-threonylcarbamoyltransferase complex transferase subunit TsaD n=1 Tax=Candidatus Epulonipiscium viviparus TaxID=420336 RepID=UPI0027380856|nr:tRNA (adenosine(37)-N6)-threonylcarbamoyltransferase complex transferase subunit TsaD [Candidatus Epulopiscium viviparus]